MGMFRVKIVLRPIEVGRHDTNEIRLFPVGLQVDPCNFCKGIGIIRWLQFSFNRADSGIGCGANFELVHELPKNNIFSSTCQASWRTWVWISRFSEEILQEGCCLLGCLRPWQQPEKRTQDVLAEKFFDCSSIRQLQFLVCADDKPGVST